MRTLSFECTVTTTSNDVELMLNNEELDLVQNGDAWKATEPRDVDSQLDVLLGVQGITGTAWSFTIEIVCDEGPNKKIVSEDGHIPPGEPSRLKKTVDLPDEPCKAENEGGTN